MKGFPIILACVLLLSCAKEMEQPVQPVQPVQDGKGADVTINGGVVIAIAGKNALGLRAIGPGSGSDDYGKLALGDPLMVRYKIDDYWSEPVPTSYEHGRKAGAWYHTEARIEPCTHPGYTAETCPYHKH